MAYEEIKQLVASDAANDDLFGAAVACSEDGSVVVVGAYGEDGSGTNRGKVYVYSGADWATETTLTASDATNGDFFGISVACSADGSVIVVGASGRDGGGTDRGKVYVYSGSSWGTETGLTASDTADDRFGCSVDCSDDGSVIVVGAYLKNGGGTNRGKAYVYSGASWATETGLTASDAANSDYFGYSVACSDDGSVVVVGAFTKNNGGTNRGKAYVYSGASWATQTGLSASDAANGDYFGSSVSCSDDGSVVAVGAFGSDGSGTKAGKAYVYSGTTWGTETKLTASDGAGGDQYGVAVACSDDGSVVVVGADLEDGAGTSRGKAYVYSGTTWATETMLSASDAANSDGMAYAVACSSDAGYVVAGAYGKNGGGTDRGQTYIFGPPSFIPQIYRRR